MRPNVVFPSRTVPGGSTVNQSQRPKNGVTDQKNTQSTLFTQAGTPKCNGHTPMVAWTAQSTTKLPEASSAFTIYTGVEYLEGDGSSDRSNVPPGNVAIVGAPGRRNVYQVPTSPKASPTGKPLKPGSGRGSPNPNMGDSPTKPEKQGKNQDTQKQTTGFVSTVRSLARWLPSCC